MLGKLAHAALGWAVAPAGIMLFFWLAAALTQDPGSGEPPQLPPFSPHPPSPPLPPAAPPLPPLTPGRFCAVCMNARSDAACSDPEQPCILDPPSFDAWTRIGHGGNSTLSSYELFQEANLTYTRGLKFLAPGSQRCLHGHTDYGSVPAAAVCRPRMFGDSCEPAPVPFVCVCVDDNVAFVAQDTLGPTQRFNFVLVGLACVGTSIFMLLSKVVSHARDYLRRRFASGQLRVSSKPRSLDETKGLTSSTTSTAADKAKNEERAARAQVHSEIRGLTQCACCTTFLLAFFGGPSLLALAVPGDVPYWVGCGSRIPNVVVARPEFMQQG